MTSPTHMDCTKSEIYQRAIDDSNLKTYLLLTAKLCYFSIIIHGIISKYTAAFPKMTICGYAKDGLRNISRNPNMYN